MLKEGCLKTTLQHPISEKKVISEIILNKPDYLNI